MSIFVTRCPLCTRTCIRDWPHCSMLHRSMASFSLDELCASYRGWARGGDASQLDYFSILGIALQPAEPEYIGRDWSALQYEDLLQITEGEASHSQAGSRVTSPAVLVHCCQGRSSDIRPQITFWQLQRPAPQRDAQSLACSFNMQPSKKLWLNPNSAV